MPEETRSLPFKAAGADLGEIHMVALATEEKALVISGRAVRSLKQYRAKMLAELSKKISRCKKGSRKYKKYARAKVRLREKTQAQLDYLYHKSTKEAIQFLLKEQVTDLVAGHPEGIEKNTNKEKKEKKEKQPGKKTAAVPMVLWQAERIFEI
ncbi:transposase [Aneurinibacillus tyrosinisolvens]|uniref:transposase n=1 Tax=Aneurinibacillus tyrosinisolvens TaxID=1443435 RepID=UPI001F291B61|nr:transposase [Aneurinibacillus tyrosinisolvens]